MFQSIQRGFGFLGQAVDMARKDGDLLKPSFYGLVVGIVAAMLGAIPIILAALLFGGRDGNNVVVYVLGALLIFGQYAIAYIFSGMTAYLVYGYLTDGDGRMERAWEIVKRDWWDILSLAAASTLVKLVENFIRGRQGNRNLIGSLVADVIDRVWTTGTYFILPAMVIEDLNLTQGVKRATFLIKNNLLLVAITEIGVGWVVGLIGFGLSLIAILIGVAIFALFAASANGDIAPLAIGGALAVLAAGALIAIVSALSSYVTTAYHTCMFLWAREAERAVAQGQSVQSVPAPAPVAAVLAPA